LRVDLSRPATVRYRRIRTIDRGGAECRLLCAEQSTK